MSGLSDAVAELETRAANLDRLCWIMIAALDCNRNRGAIVGSTEEGTKDFDAIIAGWAKEHKEITGGAMTWLKESSPQGWTPSIPLDMKVGERCLIDGKWYELVRKPEGVEE